MNVDKGLLPIWQKRYQPKRLKKILFDWQREVDWNANYLENHDQHRSLPRFGDTGKYWKESATMLAMMLLTLRGTPFVFEGEEIGMTDYPMFTPEKYVDPVNTFIFNLLRKYHFSKRTAMKWVQNFNRDNARTPVQWSNAPQAGFSTSKTTWLPVNPNYLRINAEAEKGDSSSVLNFYKKMIALRNQDPILCYGDFGPMATPGNIMVRILVGVAFKVAIGKMSLDEVKQLLDPSERKIISYKAPPEGLCLEEVIYGNAL